MQTLCSQHPIYCLPGIHHSLYLVPVAALFNPPPVEDTLCRQESRTVGDAQNKLILRSYAHPPATAP